MSQYVDFALYNHDNKKFYPLFDFGRSSYVYNWFCNYVPYETGIPLNLKHIDEVYKRAKEEIKKFKNTIELNRQKIDLVLKMNGSIEERNECISLYCNEINECQEEIDNVHFATGIIVAIENMLDHGNDIYCGIEVNWVGMEVRIK